MNRLLILPLVLMSCGSAPPEQEPPTGDRPNFLFILTDQWRGDALGVDGNELVQTPNLDRLAAEGVRFANAYAPQAVCTPSRAALLTGVYPTTNRVTDNVYGFDSVFALPEFELRPNYPEIFREAGYFSGYIGKWHLGEKDPGLFDYWAGFNSLLGHWMGEKYKSQYRSENETELALAFLDEHQDEPFSWRSLITRRTPDTRRRWSSQKLYEGKPHLEPMEYYAACTALDSYIQRLLDKLDEIGQSDNTMVVFTSDHGDDFGGRPLSSNKRVGYEESARIPMIVRYPPLIRAGSVYEGGVTTLDLMPMMLEAAGLPIPERLEGKSRIGEIEAGDLGWKEPVFQQNVRSQGSTMARTTSEWCGLRNGS